MTYRTAKFSSTLQQCLAEILINEVNDRQLKQAMIVKVMVSDDLKKAKVFITSLSLDVEALLIKLARAKGFFKKKLAKNMYLKYIPDLIFINSDELELKNEKENSQIN